MQRRTHSTGLTAALAAAILAAGGLLTTAPAQAAEQEKVCKQHEFAMALRYQQKSGEVRALQRQAFRLARMQLDTALKRHDADANLAIVTDADETLLDNSALLVRDMRNCHAYQAWDTWGHWEREGTPKLTAGAKAFLEYADAQGVSIFYVSNRFGANKPHTVETMQELDLPQVSSDTVMLWSDGNPKTERRAKIREEHTVVLLLGDTLADFSGVFEGSLAEQRAAVKEHGEKFGTEWIVFPSPTYGDFSEAELEAWDAPMKIAE